MSLQTRLAAAQCDADATLSKVEVTAAASVSCSMRAPRVPCDLEAFTVTEVRSKPLARSLRTRGGPTRVNLNADADGVKRAYPMPFAFGPSSTPGGGAYASGITLEFIGTDKTTDAKTEVTVAFVPFAKCSEHPRMVVTDPSGKKTPVRGGTSTKIHLEYPSKFDALKKAASDGAAGRPYWMWGLDPAVWEVVVDVCGVRAANGSAFGYTVTRLRVYPPDEFELEINIPPWRSDATSVQDTERRDLRSGAVTSAHEESHEVEKRGLVNRRRGESQTDSVRTSSASRGGLSSPQRSVTTREVEVHARGSSLSQKNTETSLGGRLTESTEESTSVETSLLGTQTTAKSVFKITRFGKPILDKTDEVNALWSVGKRIEDAVEGLRVFFGKMKPPQAGIVWKANFSFDFLSGAVTAKWGWQEWTDHRCYFAYGITFTLIVFSATFDFSVGVGISAGPAEVSASIGITGTVAFKLEGSLDREGPDDLRALDGSVKLKGEGSVTLYVKAIVGCEGLASATGSVTVPVSATAKPELDEQGFLLTYGAEVGATVAEIETTVAWCFKYRGERELIPRTVLIEDTPWRLA